MGVVEQRLRRILARADQHDLAGGLVARGQHGGAINEVARYIPAGKRDAHDHAVAVRHYVGRAAPAFLAVGSGDVHMRVDIGGDQPCGCRDFGGIGEIPLRVINLRASETVGIAAFERHLHGDAAVRPQFDARGREIDLMGLGHCRNANHNEADKRRAQREKSSVPENEYTCEGSSFCFLGKERKRYHDPAPTALSKSVSRLTSNSATVTI